MKYCILMGSPRKSGNTMALLRPFIREMGNSHTADPINWLYEKQIKPCTACRACQNDWFGFGCVLNDDVQVIFDEVLHSDIIILATPIYSWYCTPPMKALLDRLVYGMNKYYGDKKGPALWAGKGMACITTCGYRPEKGADLFGVGMERYCRHSGLHWLGMHCERDLGYGTTFMDEEKEDRICQFARSLPSICDVERT